MVPQPIPSKPAALNPELMNECVGVAHGNMDRVKVLLVQEPTLLNVRWD